MFRGSWQLKTKKSSAYRFSMAQFKCNIYKERSIVKKELEVESEKVRQAGSSKDLPKLLESDSKPKKHPSILFMILHYRYVVGNEQEMSYMERSSKGKKAYSKSYFSRLSAFIFLLITENFQRTMRMNGRLELFVAPINETIAINEPERHQNLNIRNAI